MKNVNKKQASVNSILFFTLLLIGAGCVSTNAIRRVDSGYRPRLLLENALTTGELSAGTQAYLRLRGLDEDALMEPEGVLIKLRNQLAAERDRSGLVAFAELAFKAGESAQKKKAKTRMLLTSARAAYSVMFDGTVGDPLDSLDPDLRFSADLYNFSLSLLTDILLAGGKKAGASRELDIVGGRMTLHKGTGTGSADAFTETLVSFTHATNEFEIQNHRHGLGVPMVTVRPPKVLVESKDLLHPPVMQSAVSPVTMLLRFKEPWSACGENLNAVTEFWNPYTTMHVDIEGASVPLEADTSLALAMLYDRNSEYRGLLRMPSLLRKESVATNRGLFLLEPYSSCKIPVVLCHGLMDSPLTWVPMLNALYADPVLRDKYQFWLFFYPSMNPVLQSASELRQSLLALHKTMSLEGRPWNDMVLVGHSMGGLISRMMISSSENSFQGVKKELEGVAGQDREFLEYVNGLTDFEPLPFVGRAVFIGAPHKGAKMADTPVGKAGSGLSLPPEYIRGFIDEKKGRAARMSALGNSIQNLSPESSVSKALGSSRWKAGLPVHSIIGDQSKAGSTNGGDSVVAYWSSHVDGVESELVVKATHLTMHKETPAIAEVRRILLKHLRVNDKR